MLPRLLHPKLLETAGYYPVVVVDGPRQSGKTTLTRAAFPTKPYVSLEPLDLRDFARADPRGFLAEYRAGAIIDEVQHAPDLVSYLQEEVDRDPTPGRFILTGSQNLAITQAAAQSLAGRAGILHLLPFSRSELEGFANAPRDLFAWLTLGGYPRIFDTGVPAARWLGDYLSTYVERDVRQILKVGDLSRFATFLKLCAAHTAQEVNLAALGADAGISYVTANHWLSVLEASFLCCRIPAFHRNVKKQLVKSPKLHFFDTGLVCHLIGIRGPDELRHHPLRGAVFETAIFAELYKAHLNRGDRPMIFHFRESRGIEVDLIDATHTGLHLIEAKSGETVASDADRSLHALERLIGTADASPITKTLVYGGDRAYTQHDVARIPWRAFAP